MVVAKTFFNRLGLLFLAALLCLPLMARAQEDGTETTTESEIEIDLEALDALSPDRETGEDEQQDPPSDVLAPPSRETDSAGQPPPLTPPVQTDDSGPLPQSPAAPRLKDLEVAPKAGNGTAAPITENFTILFEAESIDLSLQAAETLDKIARLARQSSARVQLFGYAGDEKASPSTTRRRALRRSIAIRGYLMDQGVDGTRIDLRPQGPRVEDGPREAVVIKFLEK